MNDAEREDAVARLRRNVAHCEHGTFRLSCKDGAAILAELDAYRELAADADAVARKRGDAHGLCDAMDNGGQPYPSAWATELIARAAISART